MKVPSKLKLSGDYLRFSAKLLFQWRVVVDGDSKKRRLCEERIITFKSLKPRSALVEAKRRGVAACRSFKNSDGHPVHFEFVGVMDLLCLDPECRSDEVWYRLAERVNPMERRGKLIPKDDQLNALRSALCRFV